MSKTALNGAITRPDSNAKFAALKRGAKRTAEAQARVRSAMAEIEAEMAANDGIYPQNNGALSAAEVARRAGIHPTSLFTEKLKDLGNEVRLWLDQQRKEKIVGSIKVARTLTERITDWRRQYDSLLQSHRDTELELQETQFLLAEARNRIELLEQQATELKSSVGNALLDGAIPFRPKKS